MLRRRRVVAVRGEEPDGDDEEARDLAGAERVIAEHLEHVREQRDPGAEEHQPRDVELVDARRSVVGQVPIHEEEPCRARSGC